MDDQSVLLNRVVSFQQDRGYEIGFTKPQESRRPSVGHLGGRLCDSMLGLGLKVDGENRDNFRGWLGWLDRL